MKEIILASNSPRRKELLHTICPNFTVCPSQKEEKIEPGLSPSVLVQKLAEQKADDVFSAHSQAIVIAADTVVAFEGEIFGKPKTESEAITMLSRLSGQIHSVFTGVCLCSPSEKKLTVTETKVRFRTLTQAEILAYVKTGSPMDKAGAYGIQDGNLVESVSGSYTNVVGFPMETVTELLKNER